MASFCCLVLHAPLFIVYPSCLAELKSHLSFRALFRIVMVTKYLKLELTQKIMLFFESLCFQITGVPTVFPVVETGFVCVLVCSCQYFHPFHTSCLGCRLTFAGFIACCGELGRSSHLTLRGLLGGVCTFGE